MKWFKHVTTASFKPMLMELERLYSFIGIGFYWKLAEKILLCNGSYPVAEVMSWSRKGLKKSDIEFILGPQIGLFMVDGNGMIHLIEDCDNGIIVDAKSPNPPAWDSAQVLTGAPADGPAGTPALPPGSMENRKDKKRIDIPSSFEAGASAIEGEGGEEGGKESDSLSSSDPLAKYSQEPWYKVIADLRRSEIQKDFTLMHHPLIADRLGTHWEWFVNYFAVHAIQHGEIEKLSSWRSTIGYFSNFLDNPTALQRMGEAYNRCFPQEQTAPSLPPKSFSPYCYEDHNPNGKRSYNGGRKIPQDAPPRPSATAEWNTDWDRWEE